MSADGFKLDKSKILAVVDMPVPKDRKAVRRFLGMCSFNRRFIHNFASIARPLHKLTNENVKFEWGQATQHAFEELKRCLVSAPILVYPNFRKPSIINTDASREGLGASLCQVGDDGHEHPVAYASRSLLPSETRYPVTELEGLGVHWAVKLFKPYVYVQKFTIITDHLPLVYIFKNKSHDGRFARWIVNLGGMHFEKRYRSGKRTITISDVPGTGGSGKLSMGRVKTMLANKSLKAIEKATAKSSAWSRFLEVVNQNGKPVGFAQCKFCHFLYRSGAGVGTKDSSGSCNKCSE